MNGINSAWCANLGSSTFLRSVFFVYLLVLLFVGCNRSLPVRDYVTYIQRSKGFAREFDRSGYIVIVRYNPAEYYAAREILAGAGTAFSDLLKKYEMSLMLTVHVAAKQDATVGNDVANTVQAFIIADRDTVMPVAYNYERDWGTGTGTAFVLSFDKSELPAEIDEAILMVRNLATEIGTIQVPLHDIVKPVHTRLKG